MKRQRVQRLPGMPDLAGESARTMDSVAASLRAYLEENGYDSVSTPIVEDANLFVRKSGGELVSQLYAFTDPGGQAVACGQSLPPRSFAITYLWKMLKAFQPDTSTMGQSSDMTQRSSLSVTSVFSLVLST